MFEPQPATKYHAATPSHAQWDGEDNQKKVKPMILDKNSLIMRIKFSNRNIKQ